MDRISRAAPLSAGSAAALIVGVETTRVALLASSPGDRPYPSDLAG